MEHFIIPHVKVMPILKRIKAVNNTNEFFKNLMVELGLFNNEFKAVVYLSSSYTHQKLIPFVIKNYIFASKSSLSYE